ncbi:MAG TPA: hypothetical protein VLA21_04315, partial [Candidatus Limnocylindria bacterium]|nr:hypothetical protein [Candidatus Limnocylindria bacterium]
EASPQAYALSPLPIRVALGRAAYAREASRYDAALAALGDTENQAVFPVGPADEGQAFTPEFYDSLQYLTLSPDGSRLFAVLDGLPFVHDLRDGNTTFIAPDPARGEDYYALYRRLLERLEDRAVAWSPDGRMLALAWPRAVLTQLRFGANAVLVDTEAGTASPVVGDLPPDASFLRPGPAPALGYPIRAAFSDDGATLYYEAFSAENALLGRHNRLVAHDLETGENRTVSYFTWDDLVADGGLLPVKGGFLSAVGSVKEGVVRFGLALRGLDGASAYAYAPGDAEHALQLELLDAAGGHALLLAMRLAGYAPSITLRLVSLDGLAGGLPETALAIRRDAGGAPAPAQLPLGEVYEKGDKPAAGYRDGLLYEYEIPQNGALSPDGKRLLLLTRGEGLGGDVRMYVYDLASGALSPVDLSAAQVTGDAVFGMFAGPGSNLARGLRWVGEDRVLATHGGKYRVYELKGAPADN